MNDQSITSISPAPEEKISRDEMVDSLNGFEEMAIEKQFGGEVYELSVLKQVRALAMVHFIRKGNSQPEAKKIAFELSQAEAIRLFAEDEPDDSEETDFPVTEVGKGDDSLD